MFKIRRLLFLRGLDIAVMGLELMFKGLLSPRWAVASGFRAEETKDGYTLLYERDKQTRAGYFVSEKGID